MVRSKGFFTALFDFSFSQFITLQVIGILYAIGVFFAGLAALGIIISGFSQGVTSGIFSLILSPLIFLLYVIISRIALEAIIVAFRTADNTSRIAENTRDMKNP
jgi:Domain of unknown function (DUF4282)